MGADLSAVRDAGRAAQQRERMHDRIRLEGHRGLDPRAGRVDDRHAGEHVGGVDPVPERGGGCGKLDARVDALRLVGVVRDMDGDALACAGEVAHDVREIQLALRILRL